MDNRTEAERLAAIEVKVTFMCRQMTDVHTKLDMLVPLVKENSWWVGKIKWGCATLVIVGIVGGIIKYACS